MHTKGLKQARHTNRLQTKQTQAERLPLQAHRRLLRHKSRDVYKRQVNEAMREWVNRVDDTLYVLGSVMGPHPFPMIVRDFQSVISKEARAVSYTHLGSYCILLNRYIFGCKRLENGLDSAFDNSSFLYRYNCR